MEHAVRWERIKISQNEIDYFNIIMLGDDSKDKNGYNRDGSINPREKNSDIEKYFTN